MALSTPVFIYFYAYPTFDKWRRKSNPEYPDPLKVREEVFQTLKGVAAGIIPPTISLYLSSHGMNQAYCGVGDYGYGYIFLCFMITWIGSDIFEWGYHYLGHTTEFGWQQHKYHHKFYNPSPYAVIADEWVDQFVRALPLCIFPLIAPWNIDMLFFTFGVFFYGYGVALHCGHEFDCLDSHHYWINTPYQHYLHHHTSVKNKPYHTGFFLKIWDRMAGSLYDKNIICAQEACRQGLRTEAAYKKIKKWDYSILLDIEFWKTGNMEKKGATKKTVGEKLVNAAM